MVRSAWHTLTSEIRGLHQAAYLIGLFAILSQALALIRDRAFTHAFGAGPVLDVYFTAFRIPDILFVLIASLVSAYVLIPFLSERMEAGRVKAERFFGEVVSFFLIMMGALSLAAYIWMPQLLPLSAPGLVDSPYWFELVALSQLLLLQPILLGLSGVFGALTQLSHRFVLYSLSPLLYNAGIIFGVVYLYPTWGIEGLGWGVLMGALLHLLIQLPSLRAEGMTFRLRLPSREIFPMIRIAIPRALALSSGQITLVALTSLASLFVSGSVAVLSLSLNLQSVPLSIIAVSYSVAAFPTLSQFIARKQHAEFLLHMSTAVRHIIFWSMPAIVLFIVLRAQVVRVILGSGAFTWEDTRLTAAALALFVVSVLAQGLNLLFIRAYYAAGKTIVPFIVSAVGALVTILLASWLTMLFKGHEVFRSFFEHILRVQGLPGTDVLMLPLAFTLGTFFALALFLYTYHRDFGPLATGLLRVLTQTFSASVIGGYVAYHALRASEPYFDTDTFFGIFGQGLCGGVAGIVVTVLLLLLMRSNEMRDIVDSLGRRLLRPSAVPPGQEL